MKPILLSSCTSVSNCSLFRTFALLLLLLLKLPGNSVAQCGAGYTQAQLNWDKLDYYFNNGTNVQPYGYSTGTYVTDAMEQTQKFALGPNYITIATNSNALLNPGSANGVTAENTTHTGDVAGYTGADAQYNPSAGGQTITLTFNTEVTNASFTLYDIDMNAVFTVSAANAASVAQTVTATTYAGTILTVAGTPFKTISELLNTASANNSNTGSVTISVAGPVKTITIVVTTVGNDAVFWLSDITACVTGSFPSNYNQTGSNQPFTGPAGNQPDYFMVTPDNDSAFIVDPVTGKAWFVFADPANTYMNSFAYDQYNRILYYISEGASLNANNKAVKKYDFNTATISTVIADITTLNIPTMNSGVESAAAAFYNGQLFVGFEGGRFSSNTTRESIVYRIDFDGSLNPINACQVFAINSYSGGSAIHDWADFVIEDGVLYNYNSRPGTTMVSYEHYNMMTGQSTQYLNPNAGVGNAFQAGLTWTGEQYSFSSGAITRYFENGTLGAPVTITSAQGLTWKNGAGDASENLRPQCDFGDAPASYDPVATSPAVHERFDSLRFGLTWDREWVKTSSAPASADGSDEDGIATVNVLDTATTNYIADISVYNNSGANATVGGWLDIDGDGVFEAAEYVSATVTSSASQQNVTLSWLGINTPLLVGQSTYLRIRITAAARGMGANDATGYYDIGEVEDYQVFATALLPVNLISFDAKAVNKNNVKVTWSVTGETDMNGYEIQRSSNGFRWDSADFVKARNQSGAQQYSVSDNSPLKGRSYYRLRMLEKNGVFKYSKVATITINNAEISVIIYPNPVTNQSTIKINADQFIESTLMIFNESGYELLSKKIMINPGENRIPLAVEKMPSGVYTLRIDAPMETKIVRFVKK